jgi:hypothetical protein
MWMLWMVVANGYTSLTLAYDYVALLVVYSIGSLLQGPLPVQYVCRVRTVAETMRGTDTTYPHTASVLLSI